MAGRARAWLTPVLVAFGFGALASSVSAQSVATGPGFKTSGPWVSFYGPLDEDDEETPSRIAEQFRIINLDADPEQGNVTDAQIRVLQAGGQNVVLSYLNVGACEKYRSYFERADKQLHALTTVYDRESYQDEKWADLSVEGYRKLIVDEVAQTLADRGVDGFYLDNLEVVEHGERASYGPCNAACKQGGIELVYELRKRFPDKLLVMQNATGTITRLGKTKDGVPFPSLLDGVAHEQVYTDDDGNVVTDDDARAEMKAWSALDLTVNGRPFWLAVEEYVGTCNSSRRSAANQVFKQAKADGFSAYVTDASGEQQSACFW
jgi:cysteinyl-tRNA synthetase